MKKKWPSSSFEDELVVCLYRCPLYKISFLSDNFFIEHFLRANIFCQLINVNLCYEFNKDDCGGYNEFCKLMKYSPLNVIQSLLDHLCGYYADG